MSKVKRELFDTGGAMCVDLELQLSLVKQLGRSVTFLFLLCPKTFGSGSGGWCGSWQVWGQGGPGGRPAGRQEELQRAEAGDRGPGCRPRGARAQAWREIGHLGTKHPRVVCFGFEDFSDQNSSKVDYISLYAKQRIYFLYLFVFWLRGSNLNLEGTWPSLLLPKLVWSWSTSIRPTSPPSSSTASTRWRWAWQLESKLRIMFSQVDVAAIIASASFKSQDYHKLLCQVFRDKSIYDILYNQKSWKLTKMLL